MKKLYLLTTVALLALSACDKDRMRQPEIPAVGFPEDGVVRISANADAPQTRADGTDEYAGTTLGLFLDYGSGDRLTMDNVRWTKDSGWKADRQMLWKDSKTAVKLYAYAPYVSGQDDPAKIEFSIPADQSKGTTGADLVTWANDSFTPDNNVNENFTTDGKVLITFSHRLVKLTFNFEKGSQFDSDVTVEKAVLLGTTSKVLCDATAASKVSAAADAAGQNITLHKLADLKYEAVFCPGDGQKPGATMLEVKMSDNKVLSYTVPSGGLVEGGLKFGYAYEMKMRLGKDKIEVGSISLNPWVNPGRLTAGEAEIDPNVDVWDGTVEPYVVATLPIQIENAAQLAYLAKEVNEGKDFSGWTFQLSKDLSLAGIPWTPIGNMPYSFSGSFYGHGHKIYGLKVNVEDGYAGLFGRVKSDDNLTSTVLIQNLTIVDADVATSGLSAAGIICGYADNNVKIYNCEVSGTVTAQQGFAGGVVGELRKSSTLENCKASVKVKGLEALGGLCGITNGGTILGCSVSSGEIVGITDGSGGQHIGGLVGVVDHDLDDNTIADCTVNSSVKGRIGVGGLFGTFLGAYYTVSNCTVSGTVTVTEGSCGGLVGYVSEADSFTSCGFDGFIVKEGDNVMDTGAAIGFDNSDVTFTDCWYNGAKTGDLKPVGKEKDGKEYSISNTKPSGN